jgi:hypothetical protein
MHDVLAHLLTVLSLQVQEARDAVNAAYAVAGDATCGTAVAGILIDTFVVRPVLVPALAALLGRWNWVWPRSQPTHAGGEGDWLPGGMHRS